MNCFTLKYTYINVINVKQEVQEYFYINFFQFIFPISRS